MTSDPDAVAGQLGDWLAGGPIDGLYALAGLDIERPTAELDLDWWHDGLRRRVKLLAAAARVIYERLGEAGTFLVTATRNGGAHGYDGPGAHSTMAGAVSGFTKALARERPSLSSRSSTSKSTPIPPTSPTASSTRRSAMPASSKSDGSAGSAWPLASRSKPPQAGDPAAPSGPTRWSSPPGRLGASCRRSSATWPGRRGVARSTSST